MIVKIKRFFEKALLEIFVDKYNCIICDRELQEESRLGLCPQCLGEMTFIGEKICKKCGRLQLNEADYCLTCQNNLRYFDFARSCVAYDDKAKEIVRGLKFGHRKYFGKYVSNFLIDKYAQCFADIEIDYIIPVPLTKKRQAERGYNQAQAIAQEFAEHYGLEIKTDIVAKVKQNKEQAKLTGNEREKNVFEVYGVIKPEEVKDKKILIVDDVMTTGSTVSEIARILIKAKAKNVYALTFASTNYKITGESLEDDKVDNEN
ncbi:MAG: ComF family protein [Clostridia bacterium]|nr:ComF family protein [Clostridia bacterium]MDE7329475.1 ComF family protein [Clostridia bacterium]